LADELAQALTPAGESRRLGCGERLFSFGDAAEGVYLIMRGTARATLPGEAGDELVCRTAGAGSVLGLPSALCAGRYQFDVEAIEAVEAVFLPTGRVNEILRQRPELCMQVMNMMCDELAALKLTGDHMKSCTRESCSLYGQCRQGASSQ
jgi:CRP-like cAMP-binding protein